MLLLLLLLVTHCCRRTSLIVSSCEALYCATTLFNVSWMMLGNTRSA